MTPHMLDFIRSAVWYINIPGPVLEIGSYIEAGQDHLDFRRVFPPHTPYLGMDVIEGPGVNRVASILQPEQFMPVVEEQNPHVIFCLYVLEHIWEIRRAAKSLGDIWNRNRESWLWIATHQNQPFHGTSQYGDYWRVTASAMRLLMEEAGILEPKIFVLDNTSNPPDILAIRQPISMSWPGAEFSKVVKVAEPIHWEQYC